MSRRNRRGLAAGVALAGALVVTAPVPAGAATTSGPSVTVLASGLNNPRKITVLPDGELLVAEAGSGLAGCAAGATCAGDTGAVYRYNPWLSQGRTALSGLQSVATMPTYPGQDVQGVGPVVAQPDGRGGYIVVSGNNNAATRAQIGPGGATTGTLFHAPGNAIVSDFVAYEHTNNPDGTPKLESNPFGMVKTCHGWLVADAGGNDILSVAPDGTTTTAAVIPKNDTTPAGSQYAVPTSIVRGFDGAYYISDMSGMQSGQGRIWRFVPGHAPTVVATGLTDVVDLAVQHDGSLIALTVTTGYGATGPAPGALSRVDVRTGAVTAIPTGDLLTMPTGVAVGLFGQIYVTNDSVGTSGQLIEFHPGS